VCVYKCVCEREYTSADKATCSLQFFVASKKEQTAIFDSFVLGTYSRHKPGMDLNTPLSERTGTGLGGHDGKAKWRWRRSSD